MAVQLFQPCPHHQRIGLAAEVGLLARCHLNRCDEGTAGRGDAVFNGAGDIGVGTDELGPLHHQICGFREGVKRITASLAYHHIVGVHIVHGDACVIEGVEQSRLADGKHGAARCLLPQEGGGGQCTGIEVLLRHIKAHAGQLLVQLPGRIAAVVGKKEIFLVLIMQPLNELRHPRQNAVAVVDDAVHIADEAFFLVKIDGSLLHVVPPALLVNIPSSFTVSCKESDFHQEMVNFSA